MLSRIGLDMNLGVDLDDVARNPQKYTSKAGKMKPKVKVDKSKLKENINEWKKLAQQGERELTTRKTGALTELVSSVDPFHAIVGMNPEDYADPVNIIIQKHNYAVHNRKTNLYSGYLYSENKKILQAVQDLQKRYGARMVELEAQRDAEVAAAGDDPIARHNAHLNFFHAANGAATSAFGSATNVASTSYVNKIKPIAEDYYYDVIRHVGLISDPDVRDAKDADLKHNINSALVQALSTVLSAHGSFHHYDDWDCGCSEEGLAAARKAEREEFEQAEEERIARNKAGKAVFDSKDIPPSTPLWKKLDAFGADLNIPGLFFLKGRISCARTEVRLDTSILPIPNIPQLFAGMTRNEFTGATNYEGGVNVQLVDRQVGADGRVTASVGLSGSVSTDGSGNVQDYSVSPSGELTVTSGDTTFSAKGGATFGSKGTSVSGEASVEHDGTSVKVGGQASSDGSYTGSVEASAGDGAATVRGEMNVDKDGKVTTTAETTVTSGGTTVSGKATMDSDGNTTTSGNVTVKSGNTTVTVNGQMTYGPNGELVDSDFSAGVTQDMKNGYGSSGKASFEASTKRGCTVSGELKGSIMPSDAKGKDVDKSPWEDIPSEYREKNANGEYETVKVDHPGSKFQEKPVTDKFHTKKLWSGKFCSKIEQCE